MNPKLLIPLTGLLCPLLFIGVVAAVIILILRLARGGSGVSAPPLANVPTRLGEDGFWIDSCPADPGAMIYYHYWSAGTRYSGQVPFQPAGDGRQFVYTGRQPERVSVARIVNMGDDDGGILIPPIVTPGSTWDPSDIPSPPSDPPSSAPSFPSAY